MSGDKNYSKTLIIFFFVFWLASSLKAEELTVILKEKIDTIYQKFSPSVVTLKNSVNAVAIDKDFAIVPASAVADAASVVSIDSKLNIAVIKLKELTPIKNFAKPSEADDVFFLFNAVQKEIFITKGKVKDRIVEIQGRKPPGSLLLSIDLKPLGIVTKTDEISEVLLIASVSAEINKLIKRKPGWLGLQAQTVTQELGRALSVSQGVVITNIYKGGPSDKAGLRRGDVIVEADGLKIKELKELQNLISTKFAGEIVFLRVLREGAQKDFPVLLEEPPETIAQTQVSSIPQIKGVEVSDIPEAVKSKLRESVKGVFVRKMNEDSPALGILKEGDIILEINKKSISSQKDFNEAISQAISGDLLLLIYRQDSFQYVIIPGQRPR